MLSAFGEVQNFMRYIYIAPWELDMAHITFSFLGHTLQILPGHDKHW